MDSEGTQLNMYSSSTESLALANGEQTVQNKVNDDEKCLNNVATLGQNWQKQEIVSPTTCNVKKKKAKQQQQLEEKAYVCDICCEKFAHVSTLNAHKLTHKPYACSMCEKNFTFSSNLKQHLRIHVGDFPFTCKLCGKGFTFQCRLELHEASHLGTKSFECGVCGKSFARKCILKTHEMSHTGVKSFCCPECGKGFTLRSHLNRHTKTHTGEKPFFCDSCGKNFTDKSNFIRHVRRHMENDPIQKCEECGSLFSDKAYYTRHLKKHAQKKRLLVATFAKSKIITKRNKVMTSISSCISTLKTISGTTSRNIKKVSNIHSNVSTSNNLITEQGKTFAVSQTLAKENDVLNECCSQIHSVPISS